MEIDKDKDILFLIHRHADPDAVGSAYFALQRWGGEIASPGAPDSTGQKLLSFLEIDILHTVDFDRYDQVIILDTPDPSQLEPFAPPIEKTSIIDHHSTNGWEKEVFYIDRTACSEVLYEMENPLDLSFKEGIALISGILTDTSNLQRGTLTTFQNLSDIMEKSGVDLERVKKILFEERSYSEKLARLKGAQRSSFREVNGYIIAKTQIGAFEASVSSYLLKGGADVAFTSSEDDENFRVSGRASEKVLEKGIDMGSLFQSIAEDNREVEGAGHPGAAVLSGTGSAEEYLDSCVDRMTERIEKEGLGKAKD